MITWLQDMPQVMFETLQLHLIIIIINIIRNPFSFGLVSILHVAFMMKSEISKRVIAFVTVKDSHIKIK